MLCGMSEPLHVIVTLSPETIAALAEALRPKPEPMPCEPEPVVLYRKAYAQEATRVTEDDVGRALDGRAEVTIREVMAALGIPEEKRTMALAVPIGAMLRRLGWELTGQRGSNGARERYYRPAAT